METEKQKKKMQMQMQKRKKRNLVWCNGLGKGYDEEEEDKKPCFYSPQKNFKGSFISKKKFFFSFLRSVVWLKVVGDIVGDSGKNLS